MNQLGLTLAIQAASFGTFAREASGKRHLQVLLDKPLLDADHRTATDGESLGNLPISVTGFSLTLIAHQQDSRYQVVLGRGSAGMYHRFQPLSLLLAQSRLRSGSEKISCFSSFDRLVRVATEVRVRSGRMASTAMMTESPSAKYSTTLKRVELRVVLALFFT